MCAVHVYQNPEKKKKKQYFLIENDLVISD